MFLALKEMRRTKARFLLLMFAIALLVFLILFQQTLQNGLLSAFVGAVRNQSAPVLVFSIDSQRNIQGSVITPPVEQQVRAANGVGQVGRIGQGTFSASAAGQPASVALLGYEKEGLGSPTTLTKGRLASAPLEVVASEADEDKGFGLGSTVRLEPSGLALTVVGVASNASLYANPTLYATYDTWRQAVAAANPDAAEPLPNVLGVAPAPGVSTDSLTASINAASPDADAVTKQQAADDTPGVAQIQQSFQVIFLLYGLVIPIVTGLFFLILTFQKANSLTLLRAIGAPARRLVSSLLVQVLVVMGLGIAIGVALYYPLSQGRVGGLPLQFETGAVLFWAALLLSLGLLSALFSARRVLQIDPIAATTGAGVRQ